VGEDVDPVDPEEAAPVDPEVVLPVDVVDPVEVEVVVATEVLDAGVGELGFVAVVPVFDDVGTPVGLVVAVEVGWVY
jgi:hypothetical protein